MATLCVLTDEETPAVPQITVDSRPMSPAITIVHAIAEALATERIEQSAKFSTLLQHAPVRQRVSDGVAWYPLKIRDTGYGFGEFPFVVVERVGPATPHQLSGGKPCQLFSQQGTQQRTADGVLHWVTGSVAHIVLRDNDHPEWLSEGRLGVQIMFDASGFKDMSEALKTVGAEAGTHAARFRDIIYGSEEPRGSLELPRVDAASLNTSQRNAVAQCLASTDISVIHGPPGTGKTTTLIEFIARQCAIEKPVLVCAPSNAAVDLLVERCADRNLDVVRIGNLSRIDARAMRHTLDERWKHHPMASTIKDLRARSNEFRRMAQQYKRSFGRSEAEQRKRILAEARSIIDDVRRMESQVTSMIINDADVVACTPVAVRHHDLRDKRFATAVIDEAGQALDPALWMPMLKANKVVLAGDPFQLPPTVVSQDAVRQGLSTTMLERMINSHPSSVSLLTEQYRMNATIMAFSNSEFYGNVVTAHPDNQGHTFPNDTPLTASFTVIDTSGKGWEEVAGDGNESLQNPGEALCCIGQLKALAIHPGAQEISVGVISPYRGQVKHIAEQLDAMQALPFGSLDVNTVDSFQGSECDVILISLVRSNSESAIGFLADTRRMNVALTRARKRLIVIGDGSTVASHPFYKRMLEYAERSGTLISAWSLDDESERF